MPLLDFYQWLSEEDEALVMRRALLGLVALGLTSEPTRSEAEFSCRNAYAHSIDAIEVH
jgi:hypothetical protein